MALPPLEPVRFLDWVSRGLDRANILAWLGDVNRIYRWQEAYSDIVVQTANANGLRVLNVRKDFLVSDNYAAKFCADGMASQRGPARRSYWNRYYRMWRARRAGGP